MTPREVVRMLVPRAAKHGRDLAAAEVDPPAGPADALDAGDDFFSTRTVLEDDPDELTRHSGFAAAADFSSTIEKPWM
jgi:hypothetical protein